MQHAELKGSVETRRLQMAGQTLCHLPHASVDESQHLQSSEHNTGRKIHVPKGNKTLQGVHSTQYTVHSTQYTVHSTQYTVHSTQYTVHSTKIVFF